MNPSFKSARLALLPSLLMVSLAVSGCENASSPTDSDTQEAADMTNKTDSTTGTDDTDTNLNSNVTADDSIITKQNAEQQMIDNLARYRWTLATATEGTNQPLAMLMDIKDQVTLSFNQHQGQNTLSYSVGCNTMGATYELQGHTLTTEDSMSTKMSCGDLNTAENLLNKLMQGNSEISLAAGDEPMLTQVTTDSMTLVWQGKLTAQAKYNAKGETIFWAVSSETKTCADNIAKTCLQVKPITYDDQGIKISEGEQKAFVGAIDGYQHDGKHDEVLRLQRYKLDPNAGSEEASDQEYAYVLDTVIESTIVK